MRWTLGFLCGWLLASPALAQAQLPPAFPVPADANRPAVDSLMQLLLHSVNQPRSVARPLVAQALRIARRDGQPHYISQCLRALADIDRGQGYYVQAQARYEQALALARQAQWPAGQADCYVGLGFVAYDQTRLLEAQRFYRSAARLYATLPPGLENTNYQLVVLCNLAGVHIELHQLPAAGRTLRQALALPLKGADPDYLNICYLNLADVQLQQHFPDSALHTLSLGLPLVNNAICRSNYHFQLASCNLALHRPLVAYRHAEECWRQARLSAGAEEQADALDLLAKTLHALHRPAAYDTLRRYLALHDTLLAHQQSESLLTAQARFHSTEQQAQIRALEQDRRLATQARELNRLRTQRERAGFAGLVLLVLTLGGVLFARYRQRQAAARAAAATALRQRLAADLHDDVGHLLTHIGMQSDLLRTPASPADTLARLDRLSEASRRAARQMADVVWGLQASSTTLPEVLVHMRDHAYEVLPPAGLAIDFGVTDAVKALRPAPAVCQQVYLIYKECLHNVVKHARQATQVTVRLTAEAGQLCLRVHDDAPGPAASARPGGHGLASMRQRAEAVGGRLTVVAGPGGFEVEACLPA